MCNIGKKGFCAFCFLVFGRFEKWQEPVFKCMCSWDAVSLSRKTPLFWHFRFFDFLFCFFCGDEISWHGLKLLEGTKARLVLGEVAASPMLASGVLVVRVHVADKEDRISVRWKPQPSARRKIFLSQGRGWPRTWSRLCRRRWACLRIGPLRFQTRDWSEDRIRPAWYWLRGRSAEPRVRHYQIFQV